MTRKEGERCTLFLVFMHRCTLFLVFMHDILRHGRSKENIQSKLSMLISVYANE